MSEAEKEGSDAVARRPLLVLFLRHKARFAFLVLIAGLLLIGREIGAAYPRDVDIVFELGSARRETLDVRYLLEGEEVRGAVYRGEGGLDETIDAQVSLSPGHYTISARFDDGTLVERALEVPAEGRVHISLYERGAS